MPVSRLRAAWAACLAATALSVASAFVVHVPRPGLERPLAAPRTAPVAHAANPGGGFAKETRKKKARPSPTGGPSMPAPPPKALTPENGWVELALSAPLVAGGAAEATGRSITGKPYLVRRLAAGALSATAVECGRCEFPLLKSTLETSAVDAVEELSCDMCGATFDATTGAARPPVKGKSGNPLVGGLLRSKPHRAIATYPVTELADGRVFVNVTPRPLAGATAE